MIRIIFTVLLMTLIYYYLRSLRYDVPYNLYMAQKRNNSYKITKAFASYVPRWSNTGFRRRHFIIMTQLREKTTSVIFFL